MASQSPSVTAPDVIQLKKNRIHVSSNWKPLFFYVNLAKGYMEQHGEIELAAVGKAITTAVMVAEFLKNSGFAVEKSISTSTFERRDEAQDRIVRKPKIEIVMEKAENLGKIPPSTEVVCVGMVKHGIEYLAHGGNSRIIGTSGEDTKEVQVLGVTLLRIPQAVKQNSAVPEARVISPADSTGG